MRPVNISVSGAKDYYYEKDPIFNAEGKQENTMWIGKGAEELGLSGRIDKDSFEKVLEGKDPRTGEQLVISGGKGQTHRAAVDIPISCPKSLSIAGLHLGDERLITANDRAVVNTVSDLEKEYAQYRITENGETRVEKSGNFVVAVFRHSTSRKNDPQLHSHVLITNLTKTPDGWRATRNDTIYRDQKYVSSVYLSYLAHEVKELGYAIEVKKNGTWEIAGANKEQLEMFSKRSEQIKANEKNLIESGKYKNANKGQINNIATLSTRPDKDKNITSEQLKESWNMQDREAGIDKSLVKKNIMEVGEKAKESELNRNDVKSTEYETVRIAVSQKHETESAFTKAEVLRQANVLSFGEYTPDGLERAFEELKNDKEIILTGQEKNNRGTVKEMFTTPEIQRTEKGVIETIENSKGKANIVFSRDDVQSFIETKEREISQEAGKPFNFTKDQKNATLTILSSQDNAVMIQGDAGVGKTTSMKLIKEYSEHHGITVRGFSFTGKAVNELQNAGLENVQTVSSFLLERDKIEITKGKEIWIIDESSILGSKLGSQMLEIAKENEVKVVLVGDVAQKQSISAGRFFKDIQEKTTVDKVVMSESKRFITDRQKETVEYLKEAARAFKEGDFEKIKENTNNALFRIEQAGNLKEVEDRQAVRDVAAMEYFVQVEGGKKSALVLVKTNEERYEINRLIRDERIINGEIEKGRSFMVKDIVNIHPERLYLADSYKKGQTLLFRESVKGLEQGEKTEITGIDRINNVLTVRGEDRKIHEINLTADKPEVTVYENKEREFSVGDKIIFLENDKKLKVQNGLTGTIKEIDDRGNVVATPDSGRKDIKFNLHEDLYREQGDAKQSYNKVSHGYAVTVEKAQGATVDNTIVTDLKDFNDLNVAATRGRENTVIITDDKEKLFEAVQHEQIKTSTLAVEIEQEKGGGMELSL